VCIESHGGYSSTYYKCTASAVTHMYPDACWYGHFFLVLYVELVHEICLHLSDTPHVMFRNIPVFYHGGCLEKMNEPHTPLLRLWDYSLLKTSSPEPLLYGAMWLPRRPCKLDTTLDTIIVFLDIIRRPVSI
jgi:hypothetical protein